jgi:scyllo-inositol 2-dehydrogenase (NADP+)
VRKLIASGKLGQVAEYEVRFDRYRPEPKANAWRERPDQAAAGVLWDLGPHLLDGALVIFGEPKSVTAKAIMQRATSQVDDSFDVVMDYPHTRAYLRARILAYAPGPHMLIHGTKGSFIKYGMDPQEDRLRSEKIPPGTDWGADWGEDPEQLWGTLSIAGESPVKLKTERGDYRGFYANVRDAITTGTPLDVPPEQALRTMRAVLLSHKSSREGRTVGWDEKIE